MIKVRSAEKRGRTQLDWLDSFHTFSFSSYYHPDENGFSELLVINEDHVIPGGGFATHSHRDMEIVTYVLDGALEHKDSMGNTSIIQPGDTQRMSAGKGVTHSEYNASNSEPVHFLQVWIKPNQPGITPGYEQKHVPCEEKQGKLRLIASPKGNHNSVVIHQDVNLYAAVLNHSDSIEYPLPSGRKFYLHVCRGSININNKPLSAGDGARITDEKILLISNDAETESEFLLFDLP